MIHSAHAVGSTALATERVERRLAAILAAACEDMAKQQIKNIIRPVRVCRITIDRGAEIGMETAPLPLPDKPSVAALPFTNMSGDLDQEFFPGRETAPARSRLLSAECRFLRRCHQMTIHLGSRQSACSTQQP